MSFLLIRKIGISFFGVKVQISLFSKEEKYCRLNESPTYLPIQKLMSGRKCESLLKRLLTLCLNKERYKAFCQIHKILSNIVSVLFRLKFACQFYVILVLLEKFFVIHFMTKNKMEGDLQIFLTKKVIKVCKIQNFRPGLALVL